MKALRSTLKRLPLWLAAGFVCMHTLAGDITVLHPHLLYHAEEMQVTLHAPDHADQRIPFRFEFEDKPLTQGTFGVGPDGFARLSFSAPAPRPGIPIPLTLRLPGIQAQAEEQKTTLWIFSEGSVFAEKHRLEEWPLHLYDPPGETAAWLTQHGIPFRRIRDITDVDSGVLILGEGISFRRHPDILENLLKHSTSGIPVLVINPAGGMLDLSSVFTGNPRPEFQLSGLDFLFENTPYLAGAGFAPHNFDLASERGEVRLSLRAEEGWPWLHITEKSGAPLLFSGVSLTTDKTNSPAPLLLFNALLKYLHQTSHKGGDAPKSTP